MVNANQTEEFEDLQQKFDDLQKKYDELQQQNTTLLRDNRALKKLLDSSKSLNLSKDIKIQQLKKFMGTVQNQSETVAKETATNENVPNQKMPTKKMLFERHEQYFNEERLWDLRSHLPGKPKDASFVVKCIKYMYREDMSVISQKVSGERKIKGKTPITPNKHRVFDEMITERVESEACEEKFGNSTMHKTESIDWRCTVHDFETKRSSSREKLTQFTAAKFANRI